jgi:F-type H+-transporting ATPase subunit epsilon
MAETVADTLKLTIVTPLVMVSEDVHMVTIPGVDGQMGIYPQHVALITQIVPGEIIVTQNGRESHYAIGEGLVEITATEVVIVTDMAIPAEQIDEVRAREARDRAEQRLRERLSDEEVATVNASLVRAVAQLHVRRRRSR